MKEPAYDPQRLQTDQAYQYSLIDDFTDCMEQLPDFAEQVCYYMRLCEAMGRYPCMLNIGSTTIFERECYSGYGEGKPVDREGKALTGKRWGLPAYDNTHQHKAIRNRLYFTEFYKDRSGSLFGFEIKPLRDLTTNYLQKVANHPNPEVFRQSELNAVGRKIEKYQAAVTKWANDLQVTEEIRHQFQQASELVSDELNGSDAIEWGLFYRAYHLNPFALLWDITAYKQLLTLPLSKGRKAMEALSYPDTESTNKATIISFEPDISAKIQRTLLSNRFIDSSRTQDLEAAFSGKTLTNKIVATCQINQLGHLFYQHEYKSTEVARWICQTFKAKDKELSHQSVYDAIRGKEKPTKSKKVKI